jgi:flagellar motility protein MotE (MotC chaperone)
MTDDEDIDVEQQVAELTRTVEQLRRELRRERGPSLAPRPPRLPELREFTSEVAIPGLVLLLETNVRALKLLQRTMRLADDREADRGTSVSERAEQVGSAALTRLDDALGEVQSALESQPPDSEARDLLEDAQQLQAEIEQQLDASEERSTATGPSVDVEAELQSIKDQVDDDENHD